MNFVADLTNFLIAFFNVESGLVKGSLVFLSILAVGVAVIALSVGIAYILEKMGIVDFDDI